MRKRTGQADGEPWSCFNGLVVKWAGRARSRSSRRTDLGQIGAIFDLDGDHRPEVRLRALDEDSGGRSSRSSVVN
jgi:hypothetical protein